MTLYEIVKSRMLYQFRNSPNLLKLFEDIYDQTQNVYDLLIDLRDNRDIKTARGVWLDILGDIVGLERPFYDIDKSLVFTFRELGGSSSDDMGFRSDGPPVRGGFFQSAEGLTSTPPVPMTDDDFRRLIKAKAIANNVGGNYTDLFRFLENFADVSFTVDRTGEVLITITDEWIGMRERNFIDKYGPRPAGIRIEIINW